MIWRFIKWDFKAFQMLWVLLFVATGAILSISGGINDRSIPWMFLTSFLFAIFPMIAICGTKFRSQRTMSRAYLLSLPISRKKILIVTLLRIHVFMIPLLILTLSIPLITKDLKVASMLSGIHPFSLPLLSIWAALVYGPSGVLINKRISSHVNRLMRFSIQLGHVAIALIEITLIVLFVFYMPTFWKVPHTLSFPLAWMGLALVCSARFYVTYRWWIRI